MPKGPNDAALERLRKEKEAIKREIELASKKKLEKRITKNAIESQQKSKFVEPEPVQTEQPKVKKKVAYSAGSFNDVMKLAVEREKQKSMGLCNNNVNDSRSNLKRTHGNDEKDFNRSSKVSKESNIKDNKNMKSINKSISQPSKGNEHIYQRKSVSDMKSNSHNKNIVPSSSSQNRGIKAQFGNGDVHNQQKPINIHRSHVINDNKIKRSKAESESILSKQLMDKSKINGASLNHSKHYNSGIKSQNSISHSVEKRGITAQSSISHGKVQNNSFSRESYQNKVKQSMPTDNNLSKESISRNNVKGKSTHNVQKTISSQSNPNVSRFSESSRILSQNTAQRGILAQNSGILAQNNVSRGILAQNSRGIAAQNSSLVASRGSSRIMKSSRYMDDSEDEYDEEMDDFIDNSEDIIDDTIRASIYKSLNFNPDKYAKVSRYDDCKNMESNLEHIMKEEKRSTYLAKKEDQSEFKQEEERLRKKRKMFIDDDY